LLAPVGLIFNIYLAAVTLLSHNVINPADGITFRHRPDCSKPSQTAGKDSDSYRAYYTAV